MAQLALDTCQCVLTLDDLTGEPTGYVGSPCQFHTSSPVSQPTAEVRAKNAAATAVRLIHAVANITWSFDVNRNVQVFQNGVLAATSPPMTLAQYQTAVTSPGTIVVT